MRKMLLEHLSVAKVIFILSAAKKRALLNAMRDVLNSLPDTQRDLKSIRSVDPLIGGRPHSPRLCPMTHWLISVPRHGVD
jgi:hypothetical protein